MNIPSTLQVYQPNFTTLKRTNPSSPVSFRGLECDTVEIQKNKKVGFFDKLFKREPSQKERLMELGISDKNSEALIKVLHPNNSNASKKLFNEALMAVPEIDDKDLLADFILNRVSASMDRKSFSRPKINKQAFNTFTNIFNANPSLQNKDSLAQLCSVVHYHQKSDKTLTDIEKFIDKDEYSECYLKALDTHDFQENREKFDRLKQLAELGCGASYLAKKFRTTQFDQYPFNDYSINWISNCKNDGIDTKYLVPIGECNHSEDEIKTLASFMQLVEDKVDVLGDSTDIEKDDLVELFLSERQTHNTLKLLKLWGQDAILKTLPDGYNKLSTYIDNFGDADNYKFEYIEPLLVLINPQNSKTYQRAEEAVKSAKSRFGEVKNDKERKELINEINTLSRARNSLLQNAITDNKQIVDATNIYFGLIRKSSKNPEDYVLANSVLQYLNPKTEEEKQQFRSKLNDFMWSPYEMELPEKLKDELDFSKSKYLETMFFPDIDFSDNFESLIKLLAKSKKNVPNTLDNLPQNLALMKIFKYYGWNYKKWTRFDPNLNVKVIVNYDADKLQQNAIINLESEFNSKFFTSLPNKQKNNIIKALSDGGYRLVEKSEAEFIDNGFYNGLKKNNRFYKGERPIKFKDLSNIYKLLDKEFSNNKYWDFDVDSDDIESIKKTFKNHMETRRDEIKRIHQIKGNETSTITIQKTDMNDITHALFLGNDAACCTAIGSFNDWTAPNYIKNKMVQAIELKDGDNYVGNTMMYLAAVDEKPAIFLDNIELKPKYQYNDIIEQGIIDFVKKLGEEIGIEDIDIYAGPNSHKLNMKNFEIVEKDYQLLGSTGKDEIFLDAIYNAVQLNNSIIRGTIYKLKQ